jgi:hypothetical protein
MGDESEYAKAVRHVAEARQIVAEQRKRIERLKARGHPVFDHEQTLRVFEGTLAALEDHERLLRDEIRLSAHRR